MKVKRVLAGLVLLGGVLIYAAPWVLYAVGLSIVDGRPSPPTSATLSAEEVQYLRKEFRFEGPIEIMKQSPWSYMMALYSGDFQDLRKEGTQVAWIVARHHNLVHRQGGNGWWHLSGAALTIWLTRNWTSEQILAGALQVASEEEWRSNNRLQGDAAPPRA